MTMHGCSHSMLTALALAVGGCSGSSVDVDRDGGADATSSDGRPPVATGGTRWFAVQRFQLGVTRVGAGTADPNAWMDYGFDLDARNTTAEDSKTSNASCKRRLGSPTAVLTDGRGGIDNNFGSRVMSLMRSLKSDVEDLANSSPAGGTTTLLLRLDNFGPADNGSVPGALYIAGSLGATPTFTEADAWPVTSDSLLDGVTLGAARFSFPRGYMSKGYWLNDAFGAASGEVPLPLFAALVPVNLQSAIITFDTRAGGGMIGGAGDASLLTTALTPGLVQLGICPGNATFDQVVDTLNQSRDVVLGAPHLQDTSIECNGLSLGIGFVAHPTGVPTRVVPPTVYPSTCATG